MKTITEERTDFDGSHLIEDSVKQLPSDTFMWLAGASIATSLTLKLMGRERDALFVGQWAPTFVALGIYNKLAKRMRD